MGTEYCFSEIHVPQRYFTDKSSQQRTILSKMTSLNRFQTNLRCEIVLIKSPASLEILSVNCTSELLLFSGIFAHSCYDIACSVYRWPCTMAWRWILTIGTWYPVMGRGNTVMPFADLSESICQGCRTHPA